MDNNWWEQEKDCCWQKEWDNGTDWGNIDLENEKNKVKMRGENNGGKKNLKTDDRWKWKKVTMRKDAK